MYLCNKAETLYLRTISSHFPDSILLYPDYVLEHKSHSYLMKTFFVWIIISYVFFKSGTCLLIQMYINVHNFGCDRNGLNMYNILHKAQSLTNLI